MTVCTLLLIAALAFPTIGGPPATGVTVKGKCIAVVDGDTVDIEVMKIVRVRLLDCWAPEVRTPNLAEKAKGIKAKEHMTSLAHGKGVILHIPTSTRVADALTLNRVLGRVWVDGSDLDVSAIMVRDGHATVSKR